MCASGFRYSSLQTHRQLTANTVPHPRCSSAVRLPPVLSAPEPQPVIYYLAVFCLTRVHTVGRAVAFVAGYLCHICNSVLSGAHNVVSPQHSSEDARIGCCPGSSPNSNQRWMWHIPYFCIPLLSPSFSWWIKCKSEVKTFVFWWWWEGLCGKVFFSCCHTTVNRFDLLKLEFYNR